MQTECHDADAYRAAHDKAQRRIPMPRHVEETKHFRWIRHARYDQSDAKDQTHQPRQYIFHDEYLKR